MDWAGVSISRPPGAGFGRVGAGCHKQATGEGVLELRPGWRQHCGAGKAFADTGNGKRRWFWVSAIEPSLPVR